MAADSKQNSLLDNPVASVVSVDQRGAFANAHGESALLRLAELAEGFDAEQLAADARSVRYSGSTAWKRVRILGAHGNMGPTFRYEDSGMEAHTEPRRC
jgi:hypothetical protein